MVTYLRFTTSCGCTREMRIEGVFNPPPNYMLPLFPKFAKAFMGNIPHPDSMPKARRFKFVTMMDTENVRIIKYAEDY